MGNTASSSSATTTIVQIPVDDSSFPPNIKAQYSLRDTIDPPNSNNDGYQTVSNSTSTSSTASSSILKSKYGYTIDSGTTGSSSNGGEHDNHPTNTSFYHHTSGRMMKTFPLKQQQQQQRATNRTTGGGANNNNNNNNAPLGNSNIASAATAVVKATWLLEQQSVDHNHHTHTTTTTPKFRTTTWLEDHVHELQRIRNVTIDVPCIAPYVTWGFVNSSSPQQQQSVSIPFNVSKPVLQNIIMAPQNQKYYVPNSSSSGSAWQQQQPPPSPQSGTVASTSVPTSTTMTTVSTNTAMTMNTNTTVTTSLRAVYVLRQSVYTTLADRLCRRPFLSMIEKMYLTHQLLQAVQTLHDRSIVHGCLTTENIGLTSTGYVILLDVSSPFKSKTRLPDDDPSEYVYYFQSHSNTATSSRSSTGSGTNNNSTTAAATTGNTATTTTTTTTNVSGNKSHLRPSTSGGSSSHASEKRCYLAPERFYTPTTTISTTTTASSSSSSSAGNNNNTTTNRSSIDTTSSQQIPPSTAAPQSSTTTTREPPLTVQMDIFSLGCVLTELFCNGERCFDLGDIMEYRRLNGTNRSSYNSSSTNNNNSDDSILPNTIQQKLNKIDDSTIRAACKHMIQIHPHQRCRTVKEYSIRLFHTATTATATNNANTQSYHDNKFPTHVFQRYTNLLQQMMIGTMNFDVTNKNYNGLDTKTTTVHTAIIPNTSSNVYKNSDEPTVITPDARMLLLVMEYSSIIYETMGVRDTDSTLYFERIIGQTLIQRQQKELSQSPSTITTEERQAINNNEDEEEKKVDVIDHIIGSDAYTKQLFANVEALLNDLDSGATKLQQQLDIIEDETPTRDSSSRMSLHATSSMDPLQTHVSTTDDDQNEPTTTISTSLVERSDLCKSSLLIYVQIVLSTIRHVQRPTTKVIALQLLQSLSYYVSDDVRLQRIVPVTVSLLHDSDPLVRARAVQVITTTISIVSSFPPSDSKIFPQYIFKRVAHMINDPAVIVRVTFARCIATLAETAQRFLDISHAVRLYELVGNETTSTSGLISRDEMAQPQQPHGFSKDDKDSDSAAGTTIFGDEVVKLLDAESRASSGISLNADPNVVTIEQSQVAHTDDISVHPIAGKTLIINTYSTELSSLQDSISRWVVHIATDQSEHCSLPKQAIISDLSRLCAFFGLEGVMSFILPQILAFLNERKHWQLRATLFEHLPSVCQCIGRAATEEFVLPCIEIGLVDSEERVICSALTCLSRIARVGLLSRLAIVGNAEKQETKENQSLMQKYGPLLLYPSENIRHDAIKVFISICLWIGPPDCDVFIFPTLRTYCISRLGSPALQSVGEFKKLLKPAWTRERVRNILEEIKSSERNRAWTPGAWTSIGVTENDGKKESLADIGSETPNIGKPQDPAEYNMKEYLKILSRHLTQSFMQDQSLSERTAFGLAHGIEGSGKLAQSIMFAKQNGGVSKDTIPDWYNNLRNVVENSKKSVSESVSIRTVSTLGQVYGLSTMGIEGIVKHDYSTSVESSFFETSTQNVLLSFESANIEGAFNGEWGSKSVQDPEIVDTSLLIMKLKASRVPPLPPDLGDPTQWQHACGPSTKDNSVPTDWKPRPKSLFATSSSINGHISPISRLAVSMDQTFFASSSYDGTCRVWESQQMDDSGGLLESSIVYNEHSKNGTVRINDIAMIEGSYSVVSGASDGSVHVWRVDMVKGGGPEMHLNEAAKKGRSRAVGSTNIRAVDMQEGEVLAVSQFNSSSASIITFGTQQGIVHSWDLRSAVEPFKLQYSPELGYLTSLALGSDRNWIVSGTSRGYVALWDIRFQQCVKLWRHSRCTAISRLATSTVSQPELWGKRTSTNNVRPFLFVAAGANECSMFDVLSSTCTQSFRTVTGDSRNLNSLVDDPPKLLDIAFNTNRRSGMVKAPTMENNVDYVPPSSSINCMVGSIGAGSSSHLITGGSDCSIRFWDFVTPSKCFVINGLDQMQSRPTYERIDFQGQRHLMLCRQSQQQGLRDVNKLPRKIFHGVKKPEQNHSDAILDIKVLDNNGILSCSRDGTIKAWK